MEYVFSQKVNSLAPSAIREILKNTQDPSMIPFAAGNPNIASFPVKELKEISQTVYDNPSLCLQYGITEGYTPLRDKVYSMLKDRNMTKPDDMCIITSGGQQGIDLTCKVICNEGDVVLCENPSFIGALNAFRAYNTRLVGIDMEEDGIDLNKLESALKAEKNAKLLYLIPTFQNPSGRTTSLEKRKKILQLCEKYNIIIIEDDPYGLLRFSGEEIPSLKSLDTNGQVVYCGSFSKIISSGIRIGYVLCNKDIMSKIIVAKQVNDVHTNQFFQVVLNEYLEKYDLNAHIDSIKALYKQKCNLMLSLLDKYAPEQMTYTKPDGGIFLWCTLPLGSDINSLAKALIEKKIAIVPGIAFMADSNRQCSSFRLNYSTPSDEQIEKGVKILCETVKELF